MCCGTGSPSCNARSASRCSLTEAHQVYPNGFADIGGTVGYQPYIEQEAGAATAVNEALAQDFDGIVRFAPAWPTDWNVSGSVYLQGRNKADVQVQGDQLVTAAIEAGSSGTLRVKNPWAGQQVEVVDGRSGHVVVKPTSADLVTVPVSSGRTYLVQRVAAPTTALPFALVTGSAPTAARHLGGVQLGLDGPVATGTGPSAPSWPRRTGTTASPRSTTPARPAPPPRPRTWPG